MYDIIGTSKEPEHSSMVVNGFDENGVTNELVHLNGNGAAVDGNNTIHDGSTQLYKAAMVRIENSMND